MRNASCCCGSVAIEVSGEYKLNALCHCANCRRRTGSAFGHSLYFEKSSLEAVSGTTRAYALENEAGTQVRHFCEACGTTVYWYWERFPDWVGVAGGCLADVPPSPTISACHENALEWVAIPETWQRY